MRVLPDGISLPTLLIQLTISYRNYKPSNYKRLNVKFHFKIYLVQDRLPSSHCPLFNISLYGNHFLLEWGRVYFQFDSCWEKYSTVSRKEFHYSRIIQLTAGGNNHAAIRKQLTVCVKTEQPVSDAQSGGLETTIRTPVKCPMSFFYKPRSGTQRLFPLPGAIKCRSGVTSLLQEGQLRENVLNPVAYQAAWEVFGECTGAMHSCCLATELKQPHLGGRGRREALQTQKAKESRNLQESSGSFPRLHKRHPQPRLLFEFLGQCVLKHRLSPNDDLELLTSCLHQVLGFWNAPQNRKQSFVLGRQAHQAQFRVGTH